MMHEQSAGNVVPRVEAVLPIHAVQPSRHREVVPARPSRTGAHPRGSGPPCHPRIRTGTSAGEIHAGDEAMSDENGGAAPGTGDDEVSHWYRSGEMTAEAQVGTGDHGDKTVTVSVVDGALLF